MKITSANIIENYYTRLRLAIASKKLDFTSLNFAKNAIISGPEEQFIGIETLAHMYQNLFVPALDDVIVHRLYYSDSSACAVVTLVTVNKSSVPVVEEFFIKNLQITKIQLFYDTVAWKKALAMSA